MEINYLNKLKNHPNRDVFTNEGISLQSIQNLESVFNNGNPFPDVLKEFLYLAGSYCGYLGFQSGGGELIIENQNNFDLGFYEDYGISINRPHFYIDYSPTDMPIFIFLDEGNNPEINQIESEPTQDNFYRRMGGTLPQFLDNVIQNYLDGYSPF